MELLMENNVDINNTYYSGEILGAKVISQYGNVIGRVHQLRINPETLQVEGIVVQRNLFFSVFIDRKYIGKVSSESVLLKIEPAYLLKGKRVVTTNGRVLGRVKEVVRVDKTNQIKNIVVKPLFRKPIIISPNVVKSAAQSVVLKDSYNVKERNL